MYMYIYLSSLATRYTVYTSWNKVVLLNETYKVCRNLNNNSYMCHTVLNMSVVVCDVINIFGSFVGLFNSNLNRRKKKNELSGYSSELMTILRKTCCISYINTRLLAM